MLNNGRQGGAWLHLNRAYEIAYTKDGKRTLKKVNRPTHRQLHWMANHPWDQSYNPQLVDELPPIFLIQYSPSTSAFLQNISGDYQALHLISSFIYFCDPGIPIKTLDWIFGHISHSPMNLNRLICDSIENFGGK